MHHHSPSILISYSFRSIITPTGNAFTEQPRCILIPASQRLQNCPVGCDQLDADSSGLTSRSILILPAVTRFPGSVLRAPSLHRFHQHHYCQVMALGPYAATFSQIAPFRGSIDPLLPTGSRTRVGHLFVIVLQQAACVRAPVDEIEGREST